MRIDAHQHFWNFDPVRDAWIDESMEVIRRDFTPEDLLPNLIANGIDGTVAIQADQSEDETVFLLSMSEENDFIKGVVGWVDFRANDIAERLEHFSEREKLCGFRHIAQSEPDLKFLIGKDFLNGLKYLKEFNFTYDILVFPPQLPAAIELVKKLPDQKFVLDHIAKPLIKDRIMEPWASQIKELGSAENVWCKISGIITEADHKKWKAEEIYPYLDVIFEAFGTDRLMFGSDWPVCLLAGTYSNVIHLIEEYTALLSAWEKERIFGKNAASFYGIT